MVVQSQSGVLDWLLGLLLWTEAGRLVLVRYGAVIFMARGVLVLRRKKL